MAFDDEKNYVSDEFEPDENKDSYENVCYVCHRTESSAGKMVQVAPGLHICPDCLQKTFDSVSNMGFGMDSVNALLGGAPTQTKEPDNEDSKKDSTPHIPNVQFFGFGRIWRNSQFSAY